MDPGEPPAFTTKISNAGGVAGTGTQRNAQPMLQVPAAMVNVGLVQFPVCCVLGMSTVAGPAATADGVEEPVFAPPTRVVVEDWGEVVVVVPLDAPPLPADARGATVVVVLEAGAAAPDNAPGVVVPEEPEGGGRA